MSRLDENSLKKQIKSGDFSNAYLIYGDESYLKEYYVNQIKKKTVDATFESFNFHQYDGKDTELDDILKDAQMLPMMSEYNFVLVRDYPIEKSKNDLKLLCEFLNDVAESTIFVFYYYSKEPDVKSATFKKLEASFNKAGAVVKLDKRSENEVAKLLVAGAKKRGAVLDINNAKYLISVSGNDLKSLFNEIDKLSYYANGTDITREIIDDIATKCFQAKIYDLSKAVIKCDYDAAYTLLKGLITDKDSYIAIVSTVAGVYVDMYRVKCAKLSGNSYDDVAKYYNYKGRDFALKNATRDCSKLSINQLRTSLDIIFDADLKLKSTQVDANVILEEMIVKLIRIVRESVYA